MSNGILRIAWRVALQVSCQTGPGRGASATRHDPTFGETAVVQIKAGWARSCREVSAYSTVSPEFAGMDDWSRRRSGIQNRSQ
jgi:hypothetical protein